MKFHVIIVGRLKSKRLPQKALLPLGPDHTISSFLITRLSNQLSNLSNVTITFATSYLDTDLPLHTHIINSGFKCFQGHPTNVISRLLEADKDYNSDYIIRVTADNPFTCPFHIGQLISTVELDPQIDYCLFPDLNTGLRAEIISASYLRNLHCSVKDPHSSEYMSYMLDRPDHANVRYMKCSIDYHERSFCFTVDTQEQYSYVSSLVAKGFTVLSDYIQLLSFAKEQDSPVFDFKRYISPDSSLIRSFNCEWNSDIEL